MHIGIDLGTTFSCVACVDDRGEPKVIPNSDGELTTPSVIWFDGKIAYVGKQANDRKLHSPNHIYEFIKRSIGKPINQTVDSESSPLSELSNIAAYEIGGFKYGAMGMSALILRKLKKDAINYFKKMKWISGTATEQDIQLDAVVTVPAYFGQTEREETRLAGWIAGLNVIHIVNEPTAAALTYGLAQQRNQLVMVFDLGGGTLDVTLMRIENGEPKVIASDGHNTLGGRDWDRLIETYIYEAYYRQTGRDLPDDMGFEVQRKALQAKFDLSERLETLVSLTGELDECTFPLYRTPETGDPGLEELELDLERPFYFEERATDLLTQCRVICDRVCRRAGVRRWLDIDEIIPAGGACRMPMIPKMLNQLYAPKRIRTALKGFSYDTAIAIGAALYGYHYERVRDVAPKTLGVKYLRGDRVVIDHFVKKDTPLPCGTEKETAAYPNAVLEVYEGDSELPDECALLGRLKLQNPEGRVRVRLRVEEHGLIKTAVTWAGAEKWQELTIEVPPVWGHDPARLKLLRERVQSTTIKM